MYPVTLGIPVHKNEANITVKPIIRGLKNQSSITNSKSTRDNLIVKFNIPTTKSIEKNTSINDLNPKKATSRGKVSPKVLNLAANIIESKLTKL